MVNKARPKCLHTISFGKDATTKGVQTGPGAMQFTRMPLEMRCDDRPLVKVTMAPCRHRKHLGQLSLYMLPLHAYRHTSTAEAHTET